MQIMRTTKTSVVVNLNDSIRGTLTQAGADLINENKQELMKNVPVAVRTWKAGDEYKGRIHDLLNSFGPTMEGIFENNLLEISSTETTFPGLDDD